MAVVPVKVNSDHPREQISLGWFVCDAPVGNNRNMFESFEIPDLSIFKQIAHQIFPHNLPRLRICFLSPGLCELLVLWLKFSTMAAPCRVWKGSG